MADKFMENLENFNKKNSNEMQIGEQVCDSQTGKCYVKTKDGLIEKKIESKQVITEDGRIVLKD